MKKRLGEKLKSYFQPVQKRITARVNHIDRHSDSEFVTRFRLSKECFHYLLSEIEEVIKPSIHRMQAVIIATAVLHNICINRNEELLPDNRNINILQQENAKAPLDDIDGRPGRRRQDMVATFLSAKYYISFCHFYFLAYV